VNVRIHAAALATSLALAGVSDHRLSGAQPQRAEIRSLHAVFDVSRGAVRDTNGDGLADTVAARVIVPGRPSAQDEQAAINIAGRLAFETTALTLPLVVRDSDVAEPASIAFPILVGRQNVFVKKLIDAGKLNAAALKPGQGLVALVASPLGGPDGLVVVGGDEEGTLTAGTELAARLPRLWAANGIAARAIEEQAVRHLQARGVRATDAWLSAVVVDAERRGVAAVTLGVAVPAGDGPRAIAAFTDLDQAHSRGLEPRTLNFANIAASEIDVVAEGRSAGHASVRRSGLNSRTLTPPIDPDELAADSPGDRGRAAEAPAAAGPSKTFDLSNVYSIEGWFGDVYTDLIPDRLETGIVVDRAGDGLSAAHIAARLGLESTGVTLPLVKLDETVRDPAREQNPILVGGANALIDRLVKIGKARVDDLQPGEGAVQIVPRAFGPSSATVVTGADAAGTEAAASFLARRVPYLWDNRRGAPSFDDVTRDVSRVLQAKSGAGQAGQAIGEIDDVLRSLKGKTIESFDAKISLEDANTGVDKFVSSMVTAALPGATVTASSQTMTEPVAVFEDKIDIPWEVDEFWTKFRADVLPKVKAGAPVDVELRVSESPQVRKAIADQVRAELAKAGARDPRVRVRSAYKQGFLWLTEEVAPELKKIPAAKSIRIKAARVEPDLSKKYKFYEVPSRWVHELYLADEVFQRDLGIPAANFSVELVDRPNDTYALEALDAGGKVVYQAAFSPKTAQREYLDKFPGWSRVTVTTGWLTARVGSDTVADTRIETDPERFWDYYQSKALPKIYDYVMKTTENRPMPDKQPFHRDLDVEVWMSEPDFRVGFDEEQISALEALHEDLYFVTLDFFDALGRTTTRRRLAAPGKIFPIIHPDRPGKPGQARILYAGNASAKPKVDITYKEKGVERPTRMSRELTRIDASAPVALRAVARADRVSEIEVQIEPKDDREATRAADVLDNIGRLHSAGVYRDALSYDHVDRLAVSIVAKDARTRRILRSTGASRPSNVRTAQAKPKLPIVTWDHVISPDESEEIVGKLAAFPQVKAYKAGRSYRGRDISVMEITAPTTSELVSVAKLTAYKPTIFITGRQHANEVSSTSHILKLGELLVSDPSYAETLKKVNVILHPVENPDGAQMAFELQKLTPTHMLHAGRYSALGMDVASQVGQADPLLPEALVRGNVWREWLPDIYLNPHGYPSHEWVQQFAGYVPPGFRTYLSTRGWYTSISTLRDPRYPSYAQATEAMREAVVREINSNADVRAMNLRHQARYRKWAFGFGPYVFNQEIYKDTAIYYSNEETGEPTGSRRVGAGRGGGGGGGEGAPAGGGRFSMNAWPQVTFFNSGTEAPDETAQGEWLNLVTKAGFSYLMASIKYLRDGEYAIERIGEDGQRDSVSITMFRPRPVMPKKHTGAVTNTQQ
jgi:zinc carboxypeptidase/S-layer family protein